MKESNTNTRWRLTNWLSISIFVILGLLFLIASLQITSSFWSSAFGELATIFFVSGAWNIIYDMYLRNDFVKMIDDNNSRVLGRIHDDTEKILQQVRFSDEMVKLGLQEIRADSLTYDFTNMFLESKELYIVLNHGRTWISHNTYLFRKRFQDPNKKTVIFMLHPHSPMLQVIAKKEDSTVEAIQDKIAEAVQILNSEKLENTQLQIYGHHLFNPHSVYLTEKYAITTGYYFVLGRRIVPLYKYGPTNLSGDCFFNIVREDILALIECSEDISNYYLIHSSEK